MHEPRAALLQLSKESLVYWKAALRDSRLQTGSNVLKIDAEEPLTALRKNQDSSLDSIIFDVPKPSMPHSHRYITQESFKLIHAKLAIGGSFSMTVAESFCTRKEDVSCSILPRVLRTMQSIFGNAHLATTPENLYQQLEGTFTAFKAATMKTEQVMPNHNRNHNHISNPNPNRNPNPNLGRIRSCLVMERGQLRTSKKP